MLDPLHTHNLPNAKALTGGFGFMTNIQKQMMATFLSLRVGVGVIGIVFPLLLWGGGKIAGFHLADSMSAYYHANRECIDPKRPEPTAPCSLHALPTGTGPMRNWFVGILFVMGACLYLIKGFSRWENIFLNIAGILAVCVAIFPMPWTAGQVTGFPKHYVSAVTFFISHCIRMYVLFRKDIEIYARYPEPGEHCSPLQASISSACRLYGFVSGRGLCVQCIHRSK
jgi:hypothetical protein